MRSLVVGPLRKRYCVRTCLRRDGIVSFDISKINHLFCQSKQTRVASEEPSSPSPPPRIYHYHVDLNGYLYLTENDSSYSSFKRPREQGASSYQGTTNHINNNSNRNNGRYNVASSFKDPRFLSFFFQRLEPTSESLLALIAGQAGGREIEQRDWPWVSKCGREINLVQAEDTALVYQDLIELESRWYFTGPGSNPNNRKVIKEFRGDGLTVSKSNGRMYFPAPDYLLKYNVNEIKVDSEVVPYYYRYCLIRSSVIVQHWLNDMTEGHYYFRGVRYPFNFID